MKRLVALLATLVLLLGCMSACAGKETTSQGTETNTDGATKIGYAIWSGQAEDAQAYGNSIQEAAEAAGFEAVFFDNKCDNEETVKNVENMAAQGIEYVIDGKPDTATDDAIREIIEKNDLKFISLDLPQTGGVFCGVDNQKACIPGGENLMQAAVDQWNGEFDVFVSVWNPAEGEIVQDRMKSFVTGAKNIAEIPDEKLVDVETEATSQKAMEKFSAYLTANPQYNKILVACENDGTAQGVLAAAENQNRIEDVLVVGAGCDSLAISLMLSDQKSFVGSVNFGFFDVYGEVSVELVQEWMETGEMPDTTYVETSFVTKDTLEEAVPAAELERIRESME